MTADETPFATNATRFDYPEAFSRNIGWVTEQEQDVLRAKRVAIAGAGGVGGVHLTTLARLGIGNFCIADMDEFELANFNRQVGANTATIGRPKVDVMKDMALAINPSADVRCFTSGINLDNLDAFLDGVDLFIDGLDFFVLDIRRAVFAECARRGIPAITAAPLGMGTALLNFLPGQMTFEEYFDLGEHSPDEQQMRFMLGLSPSLLQMSYVADPSRVRFGDKKAPSTPMACEMCAGVAATNALKILLNRGPVLAAPKGLHFDAYRNRLRRTWRPWGNRNPLQRVLLKIVRSFIRRSQATPAAAVEKTAETPIERILERARWAPSGDNTQPWRFEVSADDRLLIHASDTRDWCVYDLKGQASQLAVGALLESISIAASDEGLAVDFTTQRQSDRPEYVVEARFTSRSQAPDPLLPYLRARCTNRRPFSRAALSPVQKQALEASLGDGFRVIWIEDEQRRDMARLLFKSAKIRLSTEEGYRVHSRIIEWNSRYSETMIPDQAVGCDPMTLKIMRWALGSWARNRFLNRFLAGTWPPRIQLDWLPGLNCAAHFILVADRELQSVDDFLAGGRAMQRFWLTAAKLGLQFQPEMTPLIFSRYATENEAFTGDSGALEVAQSVAADLNGFLSGTDVRRAAFMGRVGLGQAPRARSIRLPLARLWQS